ncbi:uncharacterized protein DFL_008048 [Arthrobotrys flagrans]|uniref:Uncharacterized protein n=1 Tax=Arthrobotrys flagrans TaxID=97331 RepID=A0A436ZMQ2_ARTFL|nr:hypothetical protein DFL_008048 [Arthrobotrys flagrans]
MDRIQTRPGWALPSRPDSRASMKAKNKPKANAQHRYSAHHQHARSVSSESHWLRFGTLEDAEIEKAVIAQPPKKSPSWDAGLSIDLAHCYTPHKSIIRPARAREGEPAVPDCYRTLTPRLETHIYTFLQFVLSFFFFFYFTSADIRFQQSFGVVLVLSELFWTFDFGAWAHFAFKDYCVIRRYD